jgi:signal transduction histidine kinase
MLEEIQNNLGNQHQDVQEACEHYSADILGRIRSLQRLFYEIKHAVVLGDIARFYTLQRAFMQQALDVQVFLGSLDERMEAYADIVGVYRARFDIIRQKARGIAASLDFALQFLSDTAPFEPVDLKEVAREVVSDLRVHGYESPDIFLQFVDEEVVVEANRHLIKVLLSDILLNCINASDRADMVPQIIITVGAVRAVKSAMIIVEDKGPGIPEALLAEGRIAGRQKIYDLGASGANGTGVGMCSSRHIMNLHGGSLRACNNDRGGARFIATFPLAAARHAPDNRGADVAARAS